MWSRRRPDRRCRSAGFVLVEVLVTAAVAAVLLAAVMRAYASIWSGIGAVREETEAMVVARAVIEASTPRINLVPLTQEGRTGRYVWSIAIVDTGIVTTAGQASQQQQGQPPPIGQPGLLGAAAQPAIGTGRQQGGQQNNANEGESEPREPPWTLFRISVAVRAPSGRRTDLETYRLSRPPAP